MPRARSRSDNRSTVACVAVVEKTGLTLSEPSWGETSGIYPTKNDLYVPPKWDKAKECELRKARAAIDDVAKRNDRVRKGKPNSNNALEVKLSYYHMVDYFPALDAEITSAVCWFYLSTKVDAPQVHPGVPKTRIVKTYGPFHNTGGGDVPVGNVWIHFYDLADRGERAWWTPRGGQAIESGSGLMWEPLKSTAQGEHPDLPRVCRAKVKGGWLVASQVPDGWSITFVPE